MAHDRNDLRKSMHSGETGNIKGKGLLKVSNLHSYVAFSMHRGADLCPLEDHNIRSYSKHCFHNPKENESFLIPHTSVFPPKDRQMQKYFLALDLPENFIRRDGECKMVAR